MGWLGGLTSTPTSKIIRSIQLIHMGYMALASSEEDFAFHQDYDIFPSPSLKGRLNPPPDINHRSTNRRRLGMPPDEFYWQQDPAPPKPPPYNPNKPPKPNDRNHPSVVRSRKLLMNLMTQTLTQKDAHNGKPCEDKYYRRRKGRVKKIRFRYSEVDILEYVPKTGAKSISYISVTDLPSNRRRQT